MLKVTQRANWFSLHLANRSPETETLAWFLQKVAPWVQVQNGTTKLNKV